MLLDKTRLAVVAVLLLFLVLIILLSLNNTPKIPNTSTPNPTVNVNQIRTEAVSAFISELTSTAQAAPTSTSTNTPQATSTFQGNEAASPTPSCYRLMYIKDVTIPDNTAMTPAQVFTKTWLVQNNGLCAWRPSFKIILVGGIAMGGSPFTLAQTANPGDRIEISIKMAAPTDQSGIVQGTWRMSDENGTLFGDALTVVIDIGSKGSSTTPATTVTATP